MKSKKWLLLLLIVLCLGAFFGYRAWDRMLTDTQAPQISVDTQLLQVSVRDEKSVLLQGVTASDNKDGDVTASLVVESVKLLNSDGTAAVGYAAFDSAGNVAKAEREIQFSDYESPKFSLSEPLVFSGNVSFDVLDIVGAEDTLDGDIRHRVRATSLDDESIYMVGVHDVQFRVTNSLGDTVQIVLPVEVNLSGTYEAQMTLTDYLIYLPAGSRFDAEDYLDSYTVLGETTQLGANLPEEFSVRITENVDPQTPGVYPVEYRVVYTPRDARGNPLERTYTGYSKLIVVVEG